MLSQGFLKRTSAYVMSAAIAKAPLDTVSVGIQKKSIRNGLLLSLLAAKNNANNEMEIIQNRGEKILSKSPPATAASPVAFDPRIPLCADHMPGTSSARIIAASALRMPLR